MRSPAGDSLIDGLAVRLAAGGSLVITGRSGTGKTTLLRSLAADVAVRLGHRPLPRPPSGAMFLPQLPYAPLGDLRTVVCYPAAADSFADNEIRSALDAVALGHLGSRLDETPTGRRCCPPASSSASPSRGCC